MLKCPLLRSRPCSRPCAINWDAPPLGRIKVLADHLINRIAAGEVVERPASVVKELVENSLDAGARSIRVQLDAGGKQLIRVSDDGCGMDRDDALLALERHATSKIAQAADLNGIRSLGFRGEALSSIAAVSRLRLQTATRAGAGTEVEVRGGRIEAVREAGLAQGTAITVERLFFNVPARRKFLRAEATELAHVVRLMTRFALAYPELQFTLEHGGRTLLTAGSTDERLDRIAQLFGASLARRLIPFEGRAADVAVRGFAGRPVDSLPRREGQHLFVNGRAVSDRVLNHAVSAAYGNTMPRGRHPAVFVFVELDPAAVDVNVHPQKTEVRFRRSGDVHDLLRDSLHAALGEPAAVPRLEELRSTSGQPSSAQFSGRSYELREGRPEPASADGTPVARHSAAAPSPGPAELEIGAVVEARANGATRRTDEATRAVPLAQFQDSYIVAQDPQGLMLVDQHAAHERVLFERYLQEAERNRVEVQQLLFPVTVELAAHEKLILDEEVDEFRRLGFRVEPFGAHTVRLDGVPAVAAEVDPESLLRELLGEAAGARSASADVGALRHRLVTSAACQAAIKIHHPLSRPEMQRLLDDLFGAASPTTCPHGRPIVFRLSLEEIERAFRRR